MQDGWLSPRIGRRCVLWGQRGYNEDHTAEVMEKISTQLEEECLIRQSWSKQNRMSWGAWEAQLLKHATLDFGSGHDLRVVRSSLCQSPHLAGNLLEMVSSPPSAPALACALSLSL